MSVIITDASGKIQNEINEANFIPLEKLEIRVDKGNNKIDLYKLGNTAFSINKFNDDIKIIAHALGTSKIYDRNTEYYFFYITNETKNLSNILNNFLIEVEKENEKKGIKLIDNKESLFLFRDIKNALKGNSLHNNEDLMKAACEFLGEKKQPILLETSTIEKVISFIINLDKNYKILKYTIYNSTNVRFSEEPDTVNFLFNREKSIGIEPSGKFKEFIKEYNLKKILNNFIFAFDNFIESWNKADIKIKKELFKDIYTNIKDFTNILDDLIKWSESSKSGKYPHKLSLKNAFLLEKDLTNEEISSYYENVIEIWKEMNFEDQKSLSKHIIPKVNEFCTELENFNKKSKSISENIRYQQDSDLIKNIDEVFDKVFDSWEKLDYMQKESIANEVQLKITKFTDILDVDAKHETFFEKLQGFFSWRTVGIIIVIGIIFSVIAFYRYFGYPNIDNIYLLIILIFILIIILIFIYDFKLKPILTRSSKNSDNQTNKVRNKPRPKNTYINSIGMEFVLIPMGEFMMGSPSSETGRNDNEEPAHQVKIPKGFYISKYEVTQKQWRDIMKKNPSSLEGNNLPVEQISWNDVQEFIKKLNEKEDSNKYRLPSEAEWEYSARSKTTTKYYFGENESELGDYAWYAENSGTRSPKKVKNFEYDEKDWLENNWNGTAHPVGQKKSNPWGLYDVHGNLWEWVQDKWHENYIDAPTDGSAWESGESLFRVVRGGGWDSKARSCRSATRDGYDPDKRYHFLGLRLVKDK